MRASGEANGETGLLDEGLVKAVEAVVEGPVKSPLGEVVLDELYASECRQGAPLVSLDSGGEDVVDDSSKLVESRGMLRAGARG